MLPQGLGGKAGMGGNAGIGGGAVSSGGTTVTFQNYCDGGSPVPATTVQCIWTGGTPSAGTGAMLEIWHATSITISTVCDGTGTGGCTGTSTYTQTSPYTNGSNFISEIWYTCSFAGSAAITVTPNASATLYITGAWFSGQTASGTNCNDGGGPKNAQSTSSTQLTAGALTTTNAKSLLIEVLANNCGGSAYAGGTDGQGNSMTITGGGVFGVVGLQYLQESATNTYTPVATGGPTCGSGGNAQAMAFK